MTRALRANLVKAALRRISKPLIVVVSLLFLVLLDAPPATATPAQLQSREWWIARLGLEDAWKITKGSGVTVAVIDVGVDATVGDLKGALVPGFAVGGSGNPDVAHDSIGHGTSMATHIAGRGTDPGILGVAPKAKVLPVYLAGSGVDTPAALDRLTAMAHPPQVVNMSYGEDGACPADLQAAVKKAVDKGLILVASAGNDGSGANSTQYPSNCKGVVAVGAFDENIKPWFNTQRQPYVSLGGPGVKVVTYDRDREIGTSDGTSDAAAIVSGQFALLRSHFRTTPSRQLVARMFATAAGYLYKGPGYGKAGDTLGFGPARVHHALTDTVPANAPNPVYDALAALGSGESGGSSAPTTPAAPSGTVGVSFPGSGDQSTSTASGSSSSNTGVIVAVVVVAVVLVIIAGLVLVRRRSRGGAPGARL